MTRYDPFAYGSVRLGGKEGAPAAAPEDVLFADAGPVKQAPPAADSSWSLLDEDVGNLLPGSKAASTAAVEFGTEILGESMAEAPSAPAPAPAAPRPRPATSKASAPAKSAAPKAEPLARPVDAGPSQRPVTPTAKAPAPAAAPAAAASKPTAEAPRRVRAGLPGRRSRPFAAVAVPLGMCAVGGTVGSWMLVMQQNPVMAGIVAVTTVVGAAFAWLLLRG